MIALVIGSYDDHVRDAMQNAAQRAGAQCVFVSTVTRALSLLGTLESPPRCVFASLKVDFATLCEKMRENVDCYSIPLICLVDNACSESYQAANRLGADDSIAVHDFGGITRRLANLGQGSPPRLPAKEAGRAIVAVTDFERRKSVGRKLRSAGYDVQFVETELELREKSAASVPPNLLIASHSFLPAGPRDTIDVARRASNTMTLPSVVLPSSNGDLISPRELSNPEITERLMFLVDEATDEFKGETRASRRLQHSTIITFRTSRSFEHAYALTDNISRQGLYVRTMDPPTIGSDVRIEFRDNYGEVLQLRGSVAWRHAPCRVGGTTCPGFGMRLLEDACPRDDLEKYRKMYDALLEDLQSRERAHDWTPPSGVETTPGAFAGASESQPLRINVDQRPQDPSKVS